MEEFQEPCKKGQDSNKDSHTIQNQAGEEGQEVYVWNFTYHVAQASQAKHVL